MARKRHRRSPDHFAREAKRRGNPARSIFKLEEIDRRWNLLSSGDRVLELGCAPGSWTQYAIQRVGPDGRIVGYDLKPLEISLPENAEIRQGDVFAIDAAEFSYRLDVLLSDMAPSTMGHAQTDALRSAALAERALELAAQLLKPGGNVVVKVLEGASVPQIVSDMRRRYLKVEQLRPQATRKRSTEIFLVGLGKKAGVV